MSNEQTLLSLFGNNVAIVEPVNARVSLVLLTPSTGGRDEHYSPAESFSVYLTAEKAREFAAALINAAEVLEARQVHNKMKAW